MRTIKVLSRWLRKSKLKGCAYLNQKKLDAIKQAYLKGQENQKSLKKELRERPTTPTGVYFLQIRFLRLAYDQDTIKMVAQEQVKGCA